jgi:hypothetical protein
MSAGENVATITALMTIVFSMIVLGWALFYKCTDSTFKTDDLAVEKCFSFLAVPKREEPKVVESNEPVAFFSDSGPGGSMVQSTSVDDDTDDIMDQDSIKYMRRFREARTKVTSDTFFDVRASDVYNCAKICATDEIKIDEDDPETKQCGGFTTELEDSTPDDGRVMCRLYKNDNLSETGVRSYATISYIRK